MLTVLLCILSVNPSTSELERILDAIMAVESSGGRDTRDGDGGRAIGVYQIHRNYWRDGTRFLGVSWPYSDARDPIKARAVVRAYLLHYAPHGNPETWARIHNGGPTGHSKASTLRYWHKVRIVIAGKTPQSSHGESGCVSEGTRIRPLSPAEVQAGQGG